MIDSATISDFIVSNVDGDFHKKKELKISSLKLVDITKRKNPYLFKAKGMNNASDLIKSILTSSPTFALRVSGGGFPLLGDSCSRSTWFLLHRAA